MTSLSTAPASAAVRNKTDRKITPNLPLILRRRLWTEERFQQLSRKQKCCEKPSEIPFRKRSWTGCVPVSLDMALLSRRRKIRYFSLEKINSKNDETSCHRMFCSRLRLLLFNDLWSSRPTLSLHDTGNEKAAIPIHNVLALTCFAAHQFSSEHGHQLIVWLSRVHWQNSFVPNSGQILRSYSGHWGHQLIAWLSRACCYGNNAVLHNLSATFLQSMKTTIILVNKKKVFCFLGAMPFP